MKNIAEQVADLKVREKESWERYYRSVEKEVNALLKRMGDDKGCTYYVMSEAYYKAQKEDPSFKEAELLANLVKIVNEFDYIKRLAEKWYDLSSKLYRVKKALEAEDQ